MLIVRGVFFVSPDVSCGKRRTRDPSRHLQDSIEARLVRGYIFVTERQKGGHLHNSRSYHRLTNVSTRSRYRGRRQRRICTMVVIVTVTGSGSIM